MSFWSNLKQKITKKKNDQFESDFNNNKIENEIVKKNYEKEAKIKLDSINKEVPKEVILGETADVLKIPSTFIKPEIVVKEKSADFKQKQKAKKLAKKIELQNQKKKEKTQKVEKAIANSSLSFSKDIKKLSKKYKKMDDDFFEELEEVLIKTDMGIKMVLKISNSLRKKIKSTTSEEVFKETLVEEIYNFYNEGKKIKPINFEDNRLNVFMVIGVNGTGKTTSLSKIANFYAKQGKKVLIAAADTFRAGAVEQLEEWISTRLNNKVDLIKGLKQNQDPASVVYDAYEKAKNEKYDLLLIDTAGRLQNKVNLMKELEKMYQIIRQEDRKAPHELFLVIDATTGQNGVIQAKEFDGVAEVSGIVLTKMDGTSKGGIALAIKDELDIPVKLVGIGEQVDDLVQFDVDQYIYGLTVGFMEDNNDEK
ncbi:signal recognition particle-docking protein FtsY [Mesoplasma corruscae]|uniref:Signal recognition particle receptor FtsY n=1 Tax=Mesoplasma corruscae TaxID=216874 RepID=A0A2S5RGH7_9MOLU|nr:signal recognition particle-docking protein FtsY [Mesoplasma corruscae]PPE06436.1 signal recognition particle-docking protein FtsY [Mesoplasma corruscae]